MYSPAQEGALFCYLSSSDAESGHSSDDEDAWFPTVAPLLLRDLNLSREVEWIPVAGKNYLDRVLMKPWCRSSLGYFLGTDIPVSLDVLNFSASSSALRGHPMYARAVERCCTAVSWQMFDTLLFSPS